MYSSWPRWYISWIYFYLSPIKFVSAIVNGEGCSIQHYVSVVFSVNKTDRHDITEILLKVTLHTITLTLVSYIWQNGAWFSHGKPVSSINKAYLFARWRIWFYNESTIEMHELVWVSGNLNTWVWNRVVNPCSWYKVVSDVLDFNNLSTKTPY